MGFVDAFPPGMQERVYGLGFGWFISKEGGRGGVLSDLGPFSCSKGFYSAIWGGGEGGGGFGLVL